MTFQEWLNLDLAAVADDELNRLGEQFILGLVPVDRGGRYERRAGDGMWLDVVDYCRDLAATMGVILPRFRQWRVDATVGTGSGGGPVFIGGATNPPRAIVRTETGSLSRCLFLTCLRVQQASDRVDSDWRG